MGVVREFHISLKARKKYNIESALFSSRGTLVFADLSAARRAHTAIHAETANPLLRIEDLYAMGLIDEAFHIIISQYSKSIGEALPARLYDVLCDRLGTNRVHAALQNFLLQFPPQSVFSGEMSLERYVEAIQDGESGYEAALEEILMLYLSNVNPGYDAGKELIDDENLRSDSAYNLIIEEVRDILRTKPVFGPESQDLFTMLRTPAKRFPDSLQKQLEYIRDAWGYLLGDMFLKLMRAIDYLNEVNMFSFRGHGEFVKGPSEVYNFAGMDDREQFSADSEWMPNVVLLAKSTLVWLDQLSKQYGRSIRTLDQIPDEELDLLASRGFNALWLIGLWERSDASRKIKYRCGNADAAASAYALYNAEISWQLGGWDALKQLRDRCARRGIRLASDMVPNHTGIDSEWIHRHPERYLQLDYAPYASYTFNGDNLSSNPDVGIYLEDHYYDQTDASVVFKRVDFKTGETRYIYHGNDGTHMPWNDTAQLNYLSAEVREAVIQTILGVARNFPIIRFDAAMTLAKKHIHRLWFPAPGSGGDIASRSEHGMSWEEFDKLMPEEFWREVVDRVAREVPDTLLLAEAFWMMESFFVRTLGMHRVYNSAFMNMLKNEENQKYRQTIKNTIEFDKDILKRFVNFMNNPDEDTAIAQFGDGDKYFGVCTLMVTMPGLPMIGHGQIEGYTEKYGMEYQRAYKDEKPSQWLVERHEREIFPLIKKRYLFSGVENFYLFDFYAGDSVNENVYAYSNATALESAIVAYNNSIEQTSGYIRYSAGYVEKSPSGGKNHMRKTLAEALRLHDSDDAWVLFRDGRSNLWYIRKSTTLHEEGLFISLSGYESQVFLDIHEVWDNEFHHYRQLHDRLEGRGVRDISQGIRDILLKPVYDRFSSFFTADLVEKFVDFLRKHGESHGDKTERFTTEFKNFVTSVQEFTEDPQFANNADGIFAQGINNLSRMIELELSYADDEAIEYFLRRVHNQYSVETRILCFLVLHSIGRYDQEWYLEGKIVEQLGFDPGLTGTFRWLETYGEWLSESSPASADIIKALNFQPVLDAIGANYFDGTYWFNRELFEDFCWWAGAFHIITADKVSIALVRKAFKRSKEWLGLMEKSNYELEKLKPREQKKAAKKTTGTKAEVKTPASAKTVKKGGKNSISRS